MECGCRYGPHVSVRKSIFETLTSLDSKCKCCQIFLGNPQSYSVRMIDKKDAENCREYLSKNDMKLYVHANYIINLASEDENLILKGKSCLQDTLDSLSRIGSEYTGIILHPGAKGSISNIIKNINDLDLKVPLYLENTAGEGTKFGKNYDEIRLMLEGIDSKNIGSCWDSCHSFASGLVDFREMNSIDKFFEELPLHKNTIFHLNDSLTDFGGKRDRHAPMGYGYAFNYNNPGSLDRLQRLYDLSISNKIDIIFETPNPATDYFEGNFISEIMKQKC